MRLPFRKRLHAVVASDSDASLADGAADVGQRPTDDRRSEGLQSDIANAVVPEIEALELRQCPTGTRTRQSTHTSISVLVVVQQQFIEAAQLVKYFPFISIMWIR